MRSWVWRERLTGRGCATALVSFSAGGRHSPCPKWWSGPAVHIAITSSRETQQIQIALAYPAATVSSPDYYRALATTAILGGYSSARLFTEVREKRGLCYSVYAAYEGQLERAAMLCYAGTSTDRAQQTLDVVLEEIERLGSSGVALDELETMRAGLKSSLIMAQESSMSRSGSLASDWFFLGRVRPIAEIARASLMLSRPTAVSEYAAQMQANGEPTIVTLGPTALQLPP